MRYNWLRDRAAKRELYIYWDKGVKNDVDYFTKHHSPLTIVQNVENLFSKILICRSHNV